MTVVTVFLLFMLQLYTITSVDSAKVLAICSTAARSHFAFMEPLVIELSKRGHEVTVLSHFPQKTKLSNYRDISLVGTRPALQNNFPFDYIMPYSSPLAVLSVLNDDVAECENVFHLKEVKELLNSTEKFDVVINELFVNDIFVAFAYKFNAPLISIVSSILVPWSNARVANPDNPAYIQNFLGFYSSKMCFKERFINTLLYIAAKFASVFYSYQSETVARKYFGGDFPSLEQIVKNTSLLLVNSHPALHGARPIVPQVVEVGGMHVKLPNKLPEDIEEFINNSKHGVVCFSMGSMIKLSTMEQDKYLAFKTVLSSVPQRVLWKWEEDTMPDQPANVKILKWLPQRDILAHPNVKLFITHGGMLSTTEAIYSGVPIVGIPLFGDQTANLAAVEAAGVGIMVTYNNISVESIRYAVSTVLNESRYSEHAKRFSELYRDRPMAALDTAVYWTEYVIRHKGTRHLQSAAVHLAWYEYLLLDIILVIGAALIALTVICYCVSKYLLLKLTHIIRKYLLRKEKQN